MTATADPVSEFFHGRLPGHPAEVVAVLGDAPATVVFELAGDGGAAGAVWSLHVAAPAVRVDEGAAAGAGCTVRVARAAFAALLARPGGFLGLLMTGQLRLDGDRALGMRVGDLLGIGAATATATAAAPSVAAPSVDGEFRLRDPHTSAPPGVRDVERLDIQPTLLHGLFGAPGPGAGRRSSGAYRFTGPGDVYVDIHDVDLTREATGADEQRPAAELWCSTEAWIFQLATSAPDVVPAFFAWLTARIDAHAAAIVTWAVAESRAQAARGATKEARRALWKAWESVAPDARLAGTAARALADAKAALERPPA